MTYQEKAYLDYQQAKSKLNDAYTLISEAREMFFQISSDTAEYDPDPICAKAWNLGIDLGEVLDRLFELS